MRQDSFRGGMNLRDCPDNLAEDEYVWAANARVRDQRMMPVREPLEDTTTPTGNKQGLFAFEEYLLLFVSGQAFWKRYDSTGWTVIRDFQMSRTAERVYVALISGSSSNFKRLRTSASAAVAYQTDGTKLATTSGTPAGLLVQDGVSQPWIIFSDLTCRVTQTYSQWDKDNAREYVPIGTLMAVVGTKLFILGADGKSLYPSVSGRMLDFVINVTTDADKGGDADTTSHAVGGSRITAMRAASLTTLLVATAKQVWGVELDYNNTLWQEPTFINNPVMDAGIVNERSAIELLGDYLTVDASGIRSYNAVMNAKFKGQNSPFNTKVAALFVNRLQNSEDTAAVAYDNYGIFSVSTTMGYGLLIYDSLLERWVSFDQHDCVRVKNFAVTNSATAQQLWALTLSGRVFQLEAGAAYLQPSVFTRAFLDSNLQVEIQARDVTIQMEHGIAGTLRVIPYTDGKRQSARTRTLLDTTAAMLWPIEYPIDFSSRDDVDNVPVPLTGLPYARTLQMVLTWTGGAALNSLQVNAQANIDTVPDTRKALTYGS